MSNVKRLGILFLEGRVVKNSFGMVNCKLKNSHDLQHVA